MADKELPMVKKRTIRRINGLITEEQEVCIIGESLEKCNKIFKENWKNG